MVRANLVATVHSVHSRVARKGFTSQHAPQVTGQLFSDIDEPLYSCGLLESGDNVVGVLGGDWRGSAEKLSAPPRFRAVAVSGTTASKIYMRQSAPPCSRKSAVRGGIFGSSASGAQPADRAEV